MNTTDTYWVYYSNKKIGEDLSKTMWRMTWQ